MDKIELVITHCLNNGEWEETKKMDSIKAALHYAYVYFSELSKHEKEREEINIYKNNEFIKMVDLFNYDKL